MPVIDDITLAFIEKEFKNLKKGITLEVLTGPNCPLCEPLTIFVKKLCSVSNGKIKMHEKKDLTLYPGIRILENLVYRGMPSGTQTGPFIYFLIDYSTGNYFCKEGIIKQVKAIKSKVKIDLYVSPACKLSPLQTRWIYEFASLNKNLKTTVIDCVEFPEIAVRAGVTATPKTVIDDCISVVGQTDPDELLRKIKYAIERK